MYVSPIEILEDFSQYYKKLLGVRSAVDVGNPDEIGDLTSRFTFVVPDALTKFPVSFERFLVSYCPIVGRSRQLWCSNCG